MVAPEQLRDHPALGRLFESFVIEEIFKGLEATNATVWTAHYYRIRSRAEIDLGLHGPFGVLINHTEKVDWISEKIVQIPVTCI